MAGSAGPASSPSAGEGRVTVLVRRATEDTMRGSLYAFGPPTGDGPQSSVCSAPTSDRAS